MVTSTRKASRRIFREHPEALTPLFRTLAPGMPSPGQSVIRTLIPDSAEFRPLEHCVDTVLKIEPSDGDDFVLALAFQAEPEPDKAASWAHCVAFLHVTYDLPVLLLIVCRSQATASWATGPFGCRIGSWTSQVLRPLVLGPDSLPEIVDASTAEKQPMLATLAAIAHGESGEISASLETLTRAMRSLDRDTALYLGKLLEVGLGTLRSDPLGGGR
jgi:hypothetical protein